jgi:beta-1,2-mannobiose phosphorylase / 1,2-beta-oligomannan phosphorylase
MIEVKKEGIVLQKTKLGFENEGVLNPAVYKEGNFVHMFYRAVSKGNYSTIGYCKFDGPLELLERKDSPIIFPQNENEKHGVEDPRITKIEGLFYLTYTAYDGVNALGALATSTNLIDFSKLGIITPIITFEEFLHLATSKKQVNEKYLRYNEKEIIQQKSGIKKMLWDKNLIFFPRRINGKLVFLHRIRPDIQLVCVDKIEDLTKEFWQNYFICLENHIVLTSKYDHEISYLGGGCPPIETEIGWILIYHAVHDTINGYVYSACAALLDLNDPQKELARLPYPLFKPDINWELKGEVNNVCFPTGTALFDDTLYIYYGAADERIACASISLQALLTELTLYTTNDEI